MGALEAEGKTISLFDGGSINHDIHHGGKEAPHACE